MVSDVLLQDAIDSLPREHQLSGALWLSAPAAVKGRIVRLRHKLGLLDSTLMPPGDEALAQWAVRSWAQAGVTALGEVDDDPARWVRVVRNGSRYIAAGSTLLWGVELAADLSTHPLMLLPLVRQAHAGTLEQGVVSADGCVALQVQHATRWSLVTAS